jgi:ribosome-binding factor A
MRSLTVQWDSIILEPYSLTIFASMSGTVRQQKFSKLIKKELSDIFLRDRRGILENAFITISEVQMSPDLSVAKIYLSMMLAKDKQAILNRIVLRKNEIRKALGDTIRKQVRIVPELVFFIDELEEKAIKMDALIDSLQIPQEPPKKDHEE